jgi:hypothetical protein
VRLYKWGTIGLFYSYKDSYQHADYGIIVGIMGTVELRYRVYLPVTDKIVARRKPKKIIDYPPKEWGFELRNVSMLQKRLDKKLLKDESIRLSNQNVDVQTQKPDPAPAQSILDDKHTDDDDAVPDLIDDDSDDENDDAILPSRRTPKRSVHFQQEGDTIVDTIIADNVPAAAFGAPDASHFQSSLSSKPDNESVNSFEAPRSESPEPDHTTDSPAISSSPAPRQRNHKDDAPTQPARRSERERVRHDYAKLSSEGWSSANAVLSTSIALVQYSNLVRSIERDRTGMSLKSIHKEITSLLKQHKALLPIKFEDIPQDLLDKIIPIHAFLKEKFTPSGEFIKVKSRIVGGGNEQHESTFEEIDSPTINSATLMMIIHIMASMDRVAGTGDVPEAFVRPDVPSKHKIYGRMEPGLSKIVVDLYPELKSYLHNGCLYFQFAKYLYGLRQAARMFYDHMVKILTKLGFVMSQLDRCLFTKDVGDGQIVDICVHVDDLFITAANQVAFDEVSSQLKAELEVDVQCDSPYSFLGMTITRDRNNHTAKITMTAMIDKLIQKYIPNQPPKYTPYTPNLLIDEFDDSEALNAKDQATFASLNMAILYIARYCRFDSLLTPTLLASKLKRASKKHLQEALRVLQYYKATSSLGPVFGGKTVNGKIILDAVTDAAHAIMNGFGIGALALTLGAAPIIIRCWKLRMATLSSTESELLAATEVVTYIIWAREILIVLKHPQPEPTELFQDNKASIQMNEQGSGTFKRSKHLQARHMFVTQYIGEGIVKPVYMHTDRIIVDMLTKVHPRASLERNRKDAHIV